MLDTDGLVHAQLLDGRGGAREVGWDEIRSWEPGLGFLWVHLDYTAAESRSWIENESGLSAVIAAALLVDETRPRSHASGDGLLVILRGVNLNPGADPEDMISLRMWLEPNRAITLRRRRIMAVQDALDLLEAGEGPKDAGDLLVAICTALSDRMSKVIGELDEEADGLEEEVITAESYELRPKLADLRHRVIAIRRYLAPQRDVLARLVAERALWLDDVHRLHLREVADRMMRYVEDLDEARERALVTQEDLSSRLAESLNKKMYVLAVVAGIFLPLGLITGLLGINVGGIPGAGSPYGFLTVCAILAALAGLGLWIFRKAGIV